MNNMLFSILLILIGLIIGVFTAFLINLLKGMLCHVNLIPINKIENGKFSKSTNENILKFRDFLNEHGIVATVRRELGSDIDAACGQLRRKNLKTQ